jgi:hypothetical protein
LIARISQMTSNFLAPSGAVMHDSHDFVLRTALLCGSIRTG